MSLHPQARRDCCIKAANLNLQPECVVVQGHSPFRKLASRFENGLVIAVGKGEPAAVMSEYGFKKVLSIDEYTSYFKDIDPLSQYKTWKIKQTHDKDNTSQELHPSYNIYPERVEGTFVVSDPIDWGRDIQVVDTVEDAVDYILRKEFA